MWEKDNLNMSFSCQYVEHNHGADRYNGMRLMSLYQHHNFANSSFSCWEAWLNLSMEKIVIAPRKLFAIHTDVQNLFPYGWITL